MRDQSDRLTTIDLFSGAGGMAEGFKKAGFKPLLATDHDQMAATTFCYNHPEVPFLVRDLNELEADEVFERSGTHFGEIDVVCGGPPCQGFSIAGQRLNDDPRNQLFHQFVRIVDKVRPRLFVFENVTGIINMQGGSILEAILREFGSIGYSSQFKVLNAADYGVPQARPRFILIGSRDGESIGMPPATHYAHGRMGLFDHFDGRLPQVTCWDAISDLPQIDQGEGDEEMKHSGTYSNSYQRARRGNRQPGTIFNHRATGHSPLIQERYAAIPEGGNASSIPAHLQTKKANVFKLDRSRPSRTVTCNHRTDLLHPLIPRGTTVREAARLQSFDDDYRFFGNLTRKARWVTQDDQVGNAVPPLLAEAIARHIGTALGLSENVANAA